MGSCYFTIYAILLFSMGLCYFAIINNVLSGAVLFCYLCYFAITKHSIYSVGLCYFAINNVLIIIEAVLFCYY